MGSKVFLGNGPWYKKGYYGVRAGSRWPHFEEAGNDYLPFPFYLAYAAANLEQSGHDCLIIDGVGERTSEDDYIKRATDFNPSVVILEVSTPSFPVDLKHAERIKKQCPQTRIATETGAHRRVQRSNQKYYPRK